MTGAERRATEDRICCPQSQKSITRPLVPSSDLIVIDRDIGRHGNNLFKRHLGDPRPALFFA